MLQFLNFHFRGYGKLNEYLRESFAKATRFQANRILEWESVRASKAKRLIALNKLPGVWPVGIGETPDRCFEKIMGIVTGDDVKESCGSDQLCSGVARSWNRRLNTCNNKNLSGKL